MAPSSHASRWRWQNSTATLANGQAVADRRTFGCRLNAFQRDNLIYRACDRDGPGSYVVAFDPDQRTIVARWELPKTFIAPACGDGLTCTPLVATPTPQGWATYYARAPRQPDESAYWFWTATAFF